MIAPTVGRVVYYKSYGTPNGEYPSKDRAAIVTDVNVRNTTVKGSSEILTITEVRLAVLNPEGMFFTGWLLQGQEPGQWDWMPFQKDQVARMATGTINESHKSA